jgi:hypothetical protein
MKPTFPIENLIASSNEKKTVLALKKFPYAANEYAIRVRDSSELNACPGNYSTNIFIYSTSNNFKA